MIDVTRRLRDLEKRPTRLGFELLKARCLREGVSLEPWGRRVANLEKLIAIHEVMES